MFAVKVYYDSATGALVTVHMTPLFRWYNSLLFAHTRKEIAVSSGLSRSTLWRFEQGHGVTPLSAYKLAIGLQALLRDREAYHQALRDAHGDMVEIQPSLFSVGSP